MKRISAKKVILPLLLVAVIAAALLIIRPWHTDKADLPAQTGNQEQVDPGNTVPDPAPQLEPDTQSDPGEQPAPGEQTVPDPDAQSEEIDEALSEPDTPPEMVVTEEFVIELEDDQVVDGF